MKAIIIGLGNDILSDDAIGVRVARALEKREEFQGFSFKVEDISGLALAESLIGYDVAFIIDSIVTREKEAGEILILTTDDLKEPVRVRGIHDINLRSALHLFKAAGMNMPSFLRIFAVEVLDTSTFSERMSNILEEKFPKIVNKIADEIMKMMECYLNNSTFPPV